MSEEDNSIPQVMVSTDDFNQIVAAAMISALL